jgi:hypothetical protein
MDTGRFGTRTWYPQPDRALIENAKSPDFQAFLDRGDRI